MNPSRQQPVRPSAFRRFLMCAGVLVCAVRGVEWVILLWMSTPTVSYSLGCWRVVGPPWLTLLVVGIPTAVLWRRDRAAVPCGACACGYDLRGNVSGVCPECGVTVNRIAD